MTSVALALSLLSLFTLAGLALSAWSGWALSQAAGGLPAARHIAVAVPTVLFSLFTQSMVLFFFIGTGKLLKEAAAKRPDSGGPRLHPASGQRRSRPGRRPSPPSLPSRRSPRAFSGPGRTRARLRRGSTSGRAVLAVLLHVIAFGREVVAMAETNKLMDEAATLVPPARGREEQAREGRPRHRRREAARVRVREGSGEEAAIRSLSPTGAIAEEAGRAVDFLRKEEGARAEAFRADFAVDGAPIKLLEEIFSSPLFSSLLSSPLPPASTRSSTPLRPGFRSPSRT